MWHTDDEVVSICLEGDAILVICDGEETTENNSCLRLRVCTNNLRTTSTIFNAIFGPNFDEGQRLDSQTPPEISLQDDPNSIKLICYVLHFQNKKLPKSLPPSGLLNLARTIDKYDLSEAMELAIDKLLMPSTQSSVNHLLMYLHASVLLKHGPSFEATTQALILNWNGSFMSTHIKKPEHDDAIFKALIALERKRESIRAEIMDFIFKTASAIAGECKCTWSCLYAFNFVENFSMQNITPARVAGISIACVLAEIEDLPDAVEPTGRMTESCYRLKWHYDVASIRRCIRELVLRLRNVKGITLGALDRTII